MRNLLVVVSPKACAYEFLKPNYPEDLLHPRRS
jgi:hypothetical protein